LDNLIRNAVSPRYEMNDKVSFGMKNTRKTMKNNKSPQASHDDGVAVRAAV